MKYKLPWQPNYQRVDFTKNTQNWTYPNLIISLKQNVYMNDTYSD